MNGRVVYLLDRYESPKIVSGPYASPASAEARARLHADPAYRELRERLARAGVFAPAHAGYAWRMIALVAGYAALFAYLATAPALPARLAACVGLGLVHTWCNFIGHDLSHGAVARRAWVTALLGQGFDTLLTGFSFSYFRRSHTLHHYHCNEDDFDPDTLSALWSVSEHGARAKRGVGRLATRVQHRVVPLLYVLWAAVLKVQGLAYVARNSRAARADLAALALHIAGWWWLAARVGPVTAALDYAVMTGVVGVYLGVIFPIGHVGIGMVDAAGAPRSFLEHQLATTRNVTSSRVRDLLFMGLNSQIEHHLFPWAPSMRLGRARAVVRAFCRERGLPYHEVGHRAAMAAVMCHLRDMAVVASSAGGAVPGVADIVGCPEQVGLPEA
ncbi:MAG TPA: acyl-CoA desaturase [Kofleriaceae bacterium]|jgi:fatty acid desaturase|nr:acyl-CoA desaturase [Kofleriaceae bacterium]